MGGYGSGGATLSKQERCDKVYSVMASNPGQTWAPGDIYMKLHLSLSMAQIRAALTALGKEGRVLYIRSGREFGRPSSWRVVLPAGES